MPYDHLERSEDSIGKLIAELDDPHGVGDEATVALIARGVVVLDPLIRAVPGLGRLGQLGAMEVFEELGDPRAGSILIELLQSDDYTIRVWATLALGRLGVQEAIPAIKRAYRLTRERGTPPDWLEAVAMRQALAELGARTPVVPPLTRSLELHLPIAQCWPAEQLQTVIKDLADHNQVVLEIQYWEVKDDRAIQMRDGSTGWGSLDYTKPWLDVVRSALERSLVFASKINASPGAVATVQWIDQTDL